MHIALVEPSRVTQKIVMTRLEKHGHRITAFADTAAVIDRVREDETIACVITSLETAPIGGLELCWELRALSGERRPLAILVMSSDRGRRDLGEVLDCGADDFMAKPPDPDELNARLRTAERVLYLQRRLIEQADTDPLTQLLNRRAFTRQAGEAMDRLPVGISMTAMLLDIDHFKGINDQHGHDAGDLIIRAVADVLRETGAIAARIGGEEYALCLPDSTVVTAGVVAHQIRTRCARLHQARGDIPCPFTVSIGLCEWARGEGVDALLRRADIGLYASKRGGRNRVSVANAGLVAECVG